MRLPTLSLLLISAVLFGEMHAASAPIADFLPLVFAQRPVEHEQLLLHQQRAMPADDFRNWRLLLATSSHSLMMAAPCSSRSRPPDGRSSPRSSSVKMSAASPPRR